MARNPGEERGRRRERERERERENPTRVLHKQTNVPWATGRPKREVQVQGRETRRVAVGCTKRAMIQGETPIRYGTGHPSRQMIPGTGPVHRVQDEKRLRLFSARKRTWAHRHHLEMCRVAKPTHTQLGNMICRAFLKCRKPTNLIFMIALPGWLFGGRNLQTFKPSRCCVVIASVGANKDPKRCYEKNPWSVKDSWGCVVMIAIVCFPEGR
ncbi:hypothetical protein QBC38DRAFT_209432 [Podospora fimiseda]|uniref:Uncharacterized protein n=1 Tax=Podospora fimiseda TaxID=252190 RepID=A0AAN7BPB4_9PEZI|nr:hypothetical protein QBC38DRAFT_209432 [Podospora fimiseda]